MSNSTSINLGQSDTDWNATTLTTWITKSLLDSDGNPGASLDTASSGIGYLEGVYQTALLLRGSVFWGLVAAQLIERGIIDPDRHRRYTVGIDVPESNESDRS